MDALRHHRNANPIAFFAEKIRSKGFYTLPELVGSFYGERVRTAASLLIAVSWVGVIGVQIAPPARFSMPSLEETALYS